MRTSRKVTMEIAGDGSDRTSNEALDVATRRPSCRRRSAQCRASRPTSAARPRRSATSTTRSPANLPLRFGFVHGDRVPAAAAHVPLDRRADQGDRPEPALGGSRRTECSCSSSSTAGSRACWGSARPARSPHGCRCSCSSSCSACRWTTTCSSSAGSARRSTGGMRTDDAVPYAIKSTAGVATSAAIVMVAVFAIFGSLVVHGVQAARRRSRVRRPARRHAHPGRPAAGEA